MATKLYGFLNGFMSGREQLISADGQEINPSDLSQRDEVILFAPGIDVSILSAVIPVRSETEARRAAPFVVEDEIGVSVEDAHFALGPANTDIQTPRILHVTSLEVMETWSEWITEASELQNVKLVAEQSVLKPDEAYDLVDRCVANIAGRAFSIEASMQSELRQAVLEGHQPRSISDADYLRALAANAANAEWLVDLRQGRFRAQSNMRLPSLQQWRLSAGLAAVLALLWGASAVLEISSLRAQQKAIESSIESTFAQAFPNAPKQVNYLRAVASAVNAEDGGDQLAFREVSAALYTALLGVPDAQLMAVRYDRQDGALVATIIYSAYGDDAIVKAALADVGFLAELGDARQERAGVVGEVTISRSVS